MYEPEYISLSMVSHELKNPLTLIQGTLQLIESRHPKVKQDPLWMQVQGDIQYMSSLLTELTSLNSSIEIHRTWVNMRQIIKVTVDSFLTEAEKQNKQLCLNYDTDLEYMYVDGIRIREVIMNLLRNALEATKSGDRIEVVVHREQECILLNVIDTGDGMDEEQISTIFYPFTTNKENGTGLGMTIVRNIIEAHRGDITVYSKPGDGTRMEICLPIEKD